MAKQRGSRAELGKHANFRYFRPSSTFVAQRQVPLKECHKGYQAPKSTSGLKNKMVKYSASSSYRIITASFVASSFMGV